MRKVLPLFLFFESLRQNDFPLGIGEYEIFLRGLQLFGGLDYDNYNTFLKTLRQRSVSPLTSLYPKQQLLRLAKMVWLKPNQSEQLFEDLFEENYFYDLLLSGKRETRAEYDNEKMVSTPESTKQPRQDATQVDGDGETRTEESNEPLLEDDSNSSFSNVSVRIAVSERKADKNVNLGQKKKPEIEKSKFLFTQNYFPLDKRKVQQNLKLFPAFRTIRSSHEPEVAATIAKAVEKGFFNEVVYKKIKTNTSHLLLLIDHGGSMVAFTPLTETIKIALQTILRINSEGGNKSFQTMYFSNAPDKNFYENSIQTKAVAFEKVADSPRSKAAAVIVLSDAGAARGGYNPGRVAATIAFLKKVHSCTHKVAWLNPMSPDRWQNSSAEAIAGSVAMFEATEKGIRNAVDFLKGNSTKSVNVL